MARLLPAAALACAACVSLLPAPAWAAGPPRTATLGSGWEVRSQRAAPGEPQPPPPEETAPEGARASAPPTPPATTSQESYRWRPARVPGVFDTRALPDLYPGVVRRYRLRFRGPRTPAGFRWLIAFEQVRRKATVFLNGRRLGRHSDPYTPFAVEARGLRPGRRNVLIVVVDGRKSRRIPEGWWNWNGITRPVRLVPAGSARLDRLGLMPQVRCRRPGRACRASLLLDGVMERRGRRPIRPSVTVRLRAPDGRVIRRTFRLGAQTQRRGELRRSLRVPGPKLWWPHKPQLYSARVTVRDRGRVQQVRRMRIGMRSVQVKRGALFLNNRRVELRGASIHEDMPGSGAALTPADMRRMVSDLKAVGANVTRAHYVLSDRLLSMLDRAGIMVWSQAPIWQRDHRNGALRTSAGRRAARASVRRTVIAGRSHPSVITHSVANELSFTPDAKSYTRWFQVAAAREARELDPTIPISIDIKGRPGYPEQFTYRHFDMIGINQYFGWYRWVSDFSLLEPFLREMNDHYPRHALVMTEFGAESPPSLAEAPADHKGSYLFQAFHVDRTLEVVGRLRFLSGGIYWTLREFEIYPNWLGGLRRSEIPRRNTRHYKGLLTYAGERKPAWNVAREHFTGTPEFRRARRR